MSSKRKKKPQPQQKKQFIPTFVDPLPSGEKATVSLSIIVKNESKVIERMLNTVWPILDYYVVVDTGSTDGTQDIIRKFFEEKGIPGEVIDHPWKNFEDARNKAREAVKGKADFGFWIDADEQLIINKNFNVDRFKSNLSKVDGANVKIHYGGQNYFRMQFFKADFPWYWYGPVHEVLISDGQNTIGVAEGLDVLVTPDGNSWTAETQQQKYEGHAKILEEYVANDPKEDPRWLFYLAQSWRDSGTKEGREKAIEWYTKRKNVVTKGYWEECYFSALMVANLKGQNGHPEEEVLKDFLDCGKYNRHRIEHLMPIISYYQAKKDYETAYIFGLRAMQNAGKSPFPDSTLFIDESIYLWKVYDLHSISCWYSGRKSESSQVFRKLMDQINKGIVPKEHIARLMENKKWFLDGIKAQSTNINKSLV
jgi:glycosyltransferase involved in cell wall biosynthesis